MAKQQSLWNNKTSFFFICMTAPPSAPPLILASQSPSRYQLLSSLHIPFQVIGHNADETPYKNELPSMYVQRVAREKALSVSKEYPDAYVLGADTIVALGRRILRKASSPAEAASQMTLLSGRRHCVLTALALVLPLSPTVCTKNAQPQRVCILRPSKTIVAFKVLEPWEIQDFVDSQQWRDVAVYRHEAMAQRFIRFLSGRPSTISGLPMFDTYQLLKGQGFPFVSPPLAPPSIPTPFTLPKHI